MRGKVLAVVCCLLGLVGCSGGGGGGSSGAGPGAVAESEPNDGPGTALDLGSPVSVRIRGEISATADAGGLPGGDLDLFRLTAPTSGWILLTLSVPRGSDFDLGLLDGDGTRLATSREDNLDPAAEPRESLTAPLDGGETYLVEVGGFAGRPGRYSLRIEILADPVLGSVGAADTSSAAVGSMEEARCFHAAVALPDGSALIAGGTREATSRAGAFLASVSSTEIFDPSTGSFAPGPALGPPRFGLSGTALPDGRVLLAGGDLLGTAALYDSRSGEMVRTDIPLSGGMRVLHRACLLPSGRVLLTGGAALAFTPAPAAAPLATSEIFDPKTMSFTAGPPLLAPRLSHAACVLADGRVLLVGGEGRADTEVVDARPGRFASTAGPALTGVRDDHTATTLADGRVLVTGGQDGTGRSLSTAEILDDPLAGPGSAFRGLASPLSSRRADHVAIALPGGQVLLLGGEDDPGTGAPDEILLTVDIFDPVSESLTRMPDLLLGRDDHRAARLTDGRILVTGGEDAASISIRDAEAYSPR